MAARVEIDPIQPGGKSNVARSALSPRISCASIVSDKPGPNIGIDLVVVGKAIYAKPSASHSNDPADGLAEQLNFVEVAKK